MPWESEINNMGGIQVNATNFFYNFMSCSYAEQDKNIKH